MSAVVRAAVVAASPAMRAGLRAMLASPAIDVVESGAQVWIAGDTRSLPEALESAAMGADAGAVIALGDDAEVVTALRGARLAGWAVLPAGADSAQLQAAVLAAAAGLIALPAGMADQALREAAAPENADITLSPRESQILECVSRGLPNKAIAAELGISESTVKFHMQSAFAKLGAASRAEAVSKAARAGLITL